MKTIKILSIILLFFLLNVTPILADSVSTKVAKQVAKNVFTERYGSLYENFKIIETYTMFEDSQNLWYVFSFNQPINGFIIISADNIVNPLLGYSFKNTFQPDYLPPQLSYILDHYTNQILYAVENEIEPTQSTNQEWQRLLVKPENFVPDNYVDEVPPMIFAEWNQYFPYNEYCPSNTLVGCVAVAMGQVMHYWSHPTTGTGSHTYTHYVYGALSADFGETTYHFANMPYDEDESNPDLATLLYHCGVSVDMNYGPSASGAVIDGYDGSENAFKTYFKYDPDLHHEKKYQFADSVWRQMVITDLENGYPLVYAGWDGWEGHAWNLDGYEKVGDQYYFHMNWGWGGSYNGYFYLNDLSPGYVNFTGGQEAIFDLKPFASNTITCYPQNTDYWTGTTDPTAKTQTSLVNGSHPEDGWMSFDISGIPDGSEIYAVSFNGYVYERYKPNWSITPVSSNPITTSAIILHADIVAEQSAGYYYHRDESYVNYPVDWRTYMLIGSVTTDLQASLASDKFTVGIANDYGSQYRYIRYHGWNEANPPYLKVYFTAYGNIEGFVTEHGSSTPIEDVFITIGHYTDTTDANGFYSILNVPIGNYQVSIDANGYSNSNGNPYFNDTITSTISDGITTQLDFALKWAEIELSPTSLNISVDPYEISTEDFSITNDGPGNLDYSCHVEPPMGDILKSWDIEAATNEDVLYGVTSDSEFIWATGRVQSGSNHELYKLDIDGNLIATYPQGTTSSNGMRKLTFDGNYIYSYDDFGFYKIDPTNGNIETLFTDFPQGLYTPFGLTWIPGIGFCANEDDEELYIFNEAGVLLDKLKSPGIYSNDLAYDSINNCLWLAKNSTNYYYQYDLEIESLTGLLYEVPTFPNCSYQSTNAVFFITDLIEGKSMICGMTYGNPINNFFAFELETWLQITTNKYGTVDASTKASLNIGLEINAGCLTESTKSADVVISNNAGNNESLTVTINNNFTHGSLSGYIKEFGTEAPILNAMVLINGQSDITDENGFYNITNIPIGRHDLFISHADYLDDTLTNIPVTGIPGLHDAFLKWTEIEINPISYTFNLNLESSYETLLNISNTGTGDLIYSCDIQIQGKSKSPSILVVDRDMSSYNGYEEEFSDEWQYYESFLINNGLAFTYYQVYYPWHSGPNLETMQQYDIIIWFTGEAWGDYGMVEIDEINLAAYLDGGGYLFLSSQDYLTDYGWGTISFSSGDFPYDYLGLEEVLTGNWNIWSNGEMEGLTGSLASGYICELENNYWMANISPIQINDHLGIDVFIMTDPEPQGICASQYAGNGFKTVFSSVSLAAIEDGIVATNILADIISYFEGQWLFLTSNESGILPGGSKSSIDVEVLCESFGLDEGTYEAEIHVSSNDPNDLIIIPVTLNVGEQPGVELKVYLEGPYNGTSMNTNLIGLDNFPYSQPYGSAPWNYSGTESVLSVSSNIVDWVLIEYRDAINAESATDASIVDTRVAFLLQDGGVVDLDGYSMLPLNNTITQNLYVVVRHRNHLDIMSADPLVISGGVYSYDFTADVSKVYGEIDGHKEISPTVWGMIAGDGVVDNAVNDSDKNSCWMIDAGLESYIYGDFNLDSNVDNKDKNNYWHPNNGKGSQVP